MAPGERFTDRREAGRRLGAALRSHPLTQPVVLGLPRGGVPVADEVSRALGAPLDVLVVRKVGVPWQPEVAMGAVGERGTAIWNADVRAHTRISDAELDALERRERAEVEARVARFRAGRAPRAIEGRTAVVVDDGVATGASARVACAMARELGAAHVILATPVAPPEVIDGFREADEVVCLASPRSFMAVGQHYVDFAQVSDEQVVAILQAAPHADRETRRRSPG